MAEKKDNVINLKTMKNIIRNTQNIKLIIYICIFHFSLETTSYVTKNVKV